MRGSHGTCRSFAKSIEQEGFTSGSKGQVGKGIYFWIHSSSEAGKDLGRQLACVWFQASLDWQCYKDQRDKSGVVIFVEASASEDSVLDLDDVEVVENFAEFYRDVKERYKDLDRDTSSSLIDEFISVMEEVREERYSMVVGIVDVPHHRLPGNHLLRLRRRAKCMSVQDKNIIHILGIEEA